MKIRFLALLGLCAPLLVGCAAGNDGQNNNNQVNSNLNNNNNNNSGEVIYCSDSSQCSHLGDGVPWVCCSIPAFSPEYTVCAPPSNCCDCFGAQACTRCDPSTQTCADDGNGAETCVNNCVAPACSSSEDCGEQQLCCTGEENGCDACGGSCYDSDAVECTTTGWECGAGPYAFASRHQLNWGPWVRSREELQLPDLRESEARVTTGFSWQHDVGRPPPHDIAMGFAGVDSPAFQVFSRSGRLYARIGMRVTLLEARVAYKLNLTLHATQSGNRAQAVLTRASTGETVVATTLPVPANAKRIWREQLLSTSRALAPRVSFLDFRVRSLERRLAGPAAAECLPPHRTPAPSGI